MPAEFELYIQKLNEDLSLKDDKHFKSQLEYLVNQLIEKDFSSLVQILYRIDVNELQLKNLLHTNPGTDAATLITDLIIERQVQKIEFRKKSHSNRDISDEEIW
jgi:hypothetical protein